MHACADALANGFVWLGADHDLPTQQAGVLPFGCLLTLGLVRLWCADTYSDCCAVCVPAGPGSGRADLRGQHQGPRSHFGLAFNN